MGYSDEPQTQFQESIANRLRVYLERRQDMSASHLRIRFYLGKEPPAEVVMLYTDDPTLHVQCVIHGKEERQGRYQLSANHVLVSLDVQCLSRSDLRVLSARDGVHGNYLFHGRNTVSLLRTRVTEVVRGSANIQPPMQLVDELGDHHVIVERVAYRKGCEACAEHIVARMTAFAALHESAAEEMRA